MSTILKALKKSEAERQLGKSPRLGDLPQTTDSKPSAPGTQPLLIGLLSLVALALAGYLLWPDAPAPEPQRRSQQITRAGMPQRTVEPAQPVESKPSAGPKPQVSKPEAQPEPRTSPESSLETPTPEPDTETPKPEPQVPSPQSPVPSPEHLSKYALLPRYRALPQARRDSLPELTLNVLMYAEEPDRRFVLINLDRYGEGDRITDNLRVAEIIENGVVLEDEQGRFVLPRP